jgi:plastocyanin
VSRCARNLSLFFTALAAGAVAAFAVSAGAQGGGAQPPTAASVTARDNYWEVNGAPGSTATIATGGTVAFSYPSGSTEHNARFTSGPQPSCTPALPATPAPPGWSATCTFGTPGNYAFICDAHESTMQGTVEVVDPGTTPPPPPPAPPGTPPPSGDPGGSEPGSPSVKVARRQRGTTLRGSVTTAVDDSRIVITALVSNRLLAGSRPRRIRKVSVGAFRKHVATARKTAFAIRLRRVARRALDRRERLAVGLRIVITPPSGPATTKTVRVTLRPAG